MESTIRFVNSNNQYGLEALHEEAEDVDISQEGESPIPAPIDIENARQVVAGQEACNSVLASQKKNHSGDIETVSNNKHRKYNHYTQEQRVKVEEALREHGNSWSAAVIAKYANVPVSIVYTWKRELFENGIFQVLC